MQDLKRGDVIVFRKLREQVVARLEDLIWTRKLLPNSAQGPVEGPHDIEDLITFGWDVEKDASQSA